ncbi:MAG: glycoside hydrolase family 3 N-terminal domain-containing protein [Nitrospirota bacterium]|nr:glycoside hydrolase family 3 N-terminal domain-containing protein [Nitrospirota bacterium]
MHGLEQKLYQLIISRLDGERLSSRTYQDGIFELVRKGIGGFIIFGGRRDELKGFIDTIQSLSELPLFMASDIEQGVGQQVTGATRFPPQMAMAAAINREDPKDIAILRKALQAIADEAMDIGINMPLIPVLDVNQNPDNPIICTRAFSDSPETVAWFGSEYVRVLEGAGLISCAKHFPGHGDSGTDSHISLPVINKPLRDLMKTDILPFSEAINAGVSSIMVGHLSIPVIDPGPATLSKSIITGLLRKELSFDGLILTDALSMDALQNVTDIPAECIKAGVDILLHPADADSTVRGLVAAIESGDIDEGQVDMAVERILRVKMKLKKGGKRRFDYREHVELSSRITDMSITLVKGIPGLLPLKDAGETCIIFAGDEGYGTESPLRNFSGNDVQVFNIKESEGDRIGGLNTVIFAIFGSVAAWKGSSGIEDEEKGRIKECIRRAGKSIVVSFGSPYVLRHFSEADMLIAAYSVTRQAQHSVVRCLKGEMDFKGKLPVNIEP